MRCKRSASPTRSIVVAYIKTNRASWRRLSTKKGKSFTLSSLRSRIRTDTINRPLEKIFQVALLNKRLGVFTEFY